MKWPIDDLVTMDAGEVSTRLTALGLPGVTFLFWDPHERRCTSWPDANGAARHNVLEAIGMALASKASLFP